MVRMPPDPPPLSSLEPPVVGGVKVVTPVAFQVPVALVANAAGLLPPLPLEE
jgi:hypothetical protein